MNTIPELTTKQTEASIRWLTPETQRPACWKHFPGHLSLRPRRGSSHRGERKPWLFRASEVCYVCSSIIPNSSLSLPASGVTGRGMLSEMS